MEDKTKLSTVRERVAKIKAREVKGFVLGNLIVMSSLFVYSQYRLSTTGEAFRIGFVEMADRRAASLKTQLAENGIVDPSKVFSATLPRNR